MGLFWGVDGNHPIYSVLGNIITKLRLLPFSQPEHTQRRVASVWKGISDGR